MKRFVLLLIAFLLVSATANAEWLNNGLLDGKSEKNYMNAHIVIEEWQDVPGTGMPVFYAEDKCIIMPGVDEPTAPVLYDLNTGVVSELQTLPEDEARWLEMLDSFRGRSIVPEEALTEIIKTKGAADAFFTAAMNSVRYSNYYISGNYVLLNTQSCVLLIDTENAVMRPAGWGAVTEDGTVIETIIGTTSYKMTFRNGIVTEVPVSADPGYDWYIAGLDYKDGYAAVVMREAAVSIDAPEAYSACFVDDVSTGEGSNIVDIGRYRALLGPDSVIVCGKETAILFSAQMAVQYPPVLIRDGSDAATVLAWDGEKVAEYQLNEALNADGQMCYPEGSGFVIPFGSSADGRYAMFLVESYYYDIVITDMKTMKSHVLIKGDAILETMGTTLLPIVVPGSWHGEDHVSLRNGYILMFEFE